MISSVGCGLRSSRPAHHEASARNDATSVRLDDALVYAGAPSEVVGIDDQVPFVSVQGWAFPVVAATCAFPGTTPRRWLTPIPASRPSPAPRPASPGCARAAATNP